MNWQGSKVVVTGGAGFLGSHLCKALVERGAEVIVVDDFSFSGADNLADISDDIQDFLVATFYDVLFLSHDSSFEIF